jgi:hypothetical protein
MVRGSEDQKRWVEAKSCTLPTARTRCTRVTPIAAGLFCVVCSRCRAVTSELGSGGHKDVQTTMAYTHVLNRGGRGVRSPMDGFQKAVSSEGGIRRTAPVGLKQEASFRDMPQLPVNTMVAGLARGGDFVLGRPGSVLSRSA